MHRRKLLTSAAAIAVAAVSLSGWAQSYPDRSIKVVVPWPAGGNADVTIRPVLDRMSQLLAQPIVVENRAGATGTVGSAIAARAQPSGDSLQVRSANT